ncbi:hypothetical protein [Micromonospora sp. HM5-17]|jgi:hypothetical protein|uniref:hypothetical protein n=1 Tax=Micromonospora sp. HM5-17 TaxID=2487710 RepID=UPI000F495E21|nr:hypothetical protein [Micromonospora sp. HM5-17]ROT31670.1 hypothetical protein EF879_14790 [Micromonospora sp. HM5-17]
MNSGALTLVITGPVPGSERGDAEAAMALLTELHARTILNVDRPGADDHRGVEGSAGLPGSGGSAGRKGLALGPLAELVVTGLFSATTVTALAQVIVAFVQRGAARRITLRDGGRTLTISDPDEETERMVVEWLGVPPIRNGVGSGAD